MKAIELVNILRAKGITVTEYENIGQEYREHWIRAFSDPQPQKNSHLNKFLWYLFSREEISPLEKKEAAAAFDRVNKYYCWIFFQESDDVLKVEDALPLKAKDLSHVTGEYCDVYVVDKGFNWTYVIPHEEDWGPYFYRK